VAEEEKGERKQVCDGVKGWAAVGAERGRRGLVLRLMGLTGGGGGVAWAERLGGSTGEEEGMSSGLRSRD
jgi:hypothetical protein